MFSSFVVSTILSGENREAVVDCIHNKLSEIGEEVRGGKVPLEQYLITKVRQVMSGHVINFSHFSSKIP